MEIVHALTALATLTLLELVLSIDNVIFLSIAAERLPERQRPPARLIGLALAFVLRVLMLLGLSYLMGLNSAVFHVGSFAVSWSDLLLMGAGAFLMVKSIGEINAEVTAEGEGPGAAPPPRAAFALVLAQIAVLNVIFSLDSIFTAFGMVHELWIMIVALAVSVVAMMVASGPVARFVNANPSVKMLALSFLVMIGFVLIAEGLHHDIPKAIVYSSVAFGVAVEALNLARRRNLKRRRAQTPR